MRFEWFALLVVVLDITAKLVLGSMDLAAVYPIAATDISFEILSNPYTPFEHFFSSDFNTSEWLLPGGLLVLFWMIFQKGRGFLSTSTTTALGAMLATGGITTRLVDLLVYSAVVPLFNLMFDGTVTVSLNFGDMAVAAGLILLLSDLLIRQFTPRYSVLTLSPGSYSPIDFSQLPRGIDNVHVDVHISPEFIRIVRQVISSLVARYIRQGFSGEKKDKVRHQDFFILQKVYTEIAQGVIIKSREFGIEYLNLFYVALFKTLRKEIQDQTTAEIQQVTEARSGQANNEKAKWLFRNRNLIFNKVSKALFAMLYKIELDSLSKFHKSVAGTDGVQDLVDAFRRPLAYAASPIDDDIMCQNYVLMGHLRSDPHGFARLDSMLEVLLSANLHALKEPAETPVEVMSVGDESGPSEEPEDATVDLDDDNPSNEDDARKFELREVISSNEYQRLFDNPSVLMAEENIDILVNPSWTRHQMQLAWDARDFRRYLLYRRHYRFQRTQLAHLRNTLENSRLLSTVVAAYEAAEMSQRFQGETQPALLHKLIDQKGALGSGYRIDNIYRSTPDLPPKEEVVAAIKRVQATLKGNIDAVLVRFVRDFAAYRRDLRLNTLLQQAANQIALRDNENDILTSRSNNLLFDFVATSEIDQQNKVIRSHTIVKADLRGSTQITEELTRRKLNPATHFSRNFFGPINEVIETFGAEKVFIEGDAIILILNEYVGHHVESLIVSRACGLATGMLRVMEHQNTQLAAHGLPQLELGIGIAFEVSSPNFLFDGDHRITISPAINRADRLSACAWALRQWFDGKASNQTHVAVYEPSRETREQMGEKSQKDMVYNLNGILIEPAAFAKLKSELTLKEQPHHIDEYWDSRLYTSRYPDTKGRYHPLIVREGAVREYDTSFEYLETPKIDGRMFYEIVYDRKVLEQLRNSMVQRDAKSSSARSAQA